MENMTEGTPKTLEVVPPTPTVVDVMPPRKQVENTLNYLAATYELLQKGLFFGEQSNALIQVKAWIENQQKYLSLQMAKMIAADSEKTNA